MENNTSNNNQEIFNYETNSNVNININKKSVTCWKCSNKFYVNDSQDIAQCPKCNKYNSVPIGNKPRNTNHLFTTNVSNLNNFENKITNDKLNNIITCPFCYTKNLFRREADELICYHCSKNIKEGFGSSLEINTEGEQTSLNNNKIVGWRIVPSPEILTGITTLSQYPMTPPTQSSSNTDYLLKKILKSLKKQKSETNTIQTPKYNPIPTPTFIPYPMIDYCSNRGRTRYIDNDYNIGKNYNIHSSEIKYIPIKNEPEKKDKDGYRIIIRRKNKSRKGTSKSSVFEKVFYLK